MATSAAVEACFWPNYDPDQAGSMRGGVPVEKALVCWEDYRGAYDVHLALQDWRQKQGRDLEVPHAMFWQGMATHGHALALSDERKLSPLPQIPTGYGGIVFTFVQRLLSRSVIGQTGIATPAKDLHRLLSSAQKWRPWLTHESIPGVPDGFILALALPRVNSLQKKSKEALSKVLVAWCDETEPQVRSSWVTSLISQALPVWGEGGIQQASVFPKVPDATTFWDPNAVLSPFDLLQGLVALSRHPGWGAPFDATFETVLPQVLRALRSNLSQPLRYHRTAHRKEHADMVSAYSGVSAALPAVDWVRWHIQTLPFPDAKATSGVSRPLDQKELIATWSRLMKDHHAMMVSEFSPAEVGHLTAVPELLAQWRAGVLAASSTVPSASPTRRRPRA